MKGWKMPVFPCRAAAVFREVLLERLLIGLAQGALLYFAFDAAHNRALASEDRLVLIPLWLIALFAPPLAVIGAGRLTLGRRAFWCVLLALVLAVIGYHDAWRAAAPPWISLTAEATAHANVPSWEVTLGAVAVAYFVAVLALANDRTRKIIPPYPAWFESAWTLALQIVASLGFVGLLQLVLLIGASLFSVVKIDFLEHLRSQPHFQIPVSSVAFSVGLHVAEARTNLIRGLQALSLTLMSWLVAPFAMLIAAFLATLPFVGLAPLWAAYSATGLLLAAAVFSVILVNAVFAESGATQAASRVARVSARACCLMLPVLVSLAGYALSLRIREYGLTSERVTAAAFIFVAGCYAVGYALAALHRAPDLRLVAPTNIATACVSVLVVLALLSPLADPARLSVEAQVRRLVTGQIAPDKFDFNFLRFGAAIYGYEALERLQHQSSGLDAAAIREKSQQAAQWSEPRAANERKFDVATLSRDIVMRTPGLTLPESFLRNDWQAAIVRSDRYVLPSCLRTEATKCDAYMIELGAEPAAKAANILLVAQDSGYGAVFADDGDGKWAIAGTFNIDCTGARQALASGQVLRLLAPRFPDMEIGGERIQIHPVSETGRACGR